MMGLGRMGSGAGGNSSSSTSNLSALAPPFTVDRINPKPSTNPNFHYSESPYVAEPFTHPWQYARPSAPGPEMVIDSSEITSAPVSDDYRFSASASFSPSSTEWSAIISSTKATGSGFAYGSEMKPYYSLYVPPLGGEDSLTVEDERSHYNVVPTSDSQSFFDLEYGPRWVDSLRVDYGNQTKVSELDGSFSSGKENDGGSHSYVNQLYEGGHSIENRSKPKEDSGILYKNVNQVSKRENHPGSSIYEHTQDESFHEHNLGFLPYNLNRIPVTTSRSPYLDTYPSAISCEMQKNFPNYQNSYSSYEKCVRPFETPFSGRASFVRASPAVVIRPPPATTGSSWQNISAYKRACVENVGEVSSVDFDYTNSPKLKDCGLQSSSKTKKECLETNLINFSNQGNDLTSSTSVRELLTPLHSRDTSDCNVKERFGSRLPNINISSGSHVADGKDSLDNIDYHSTAVDSPCWKGATSSQFPTFDIETGNSNNPKVNLDEAYGLVSEEHKNLCSVVHSDLIFSEKVEGNIGKENECARNGLALDLERNLNAIGSTKEESLLDTGMKDTVWTSPMTRSKGVELSDDPNMLNKESNLLNNLTSVFYTKVSEAKHSIVEEGSRMIANDVSGGAAVAVHVAEKVLASPASQNAIEHAVVSEPKLNASSMIRAIHNLSELLLFHLSSDACFLDEENTENLNHVISNLDVCLRKKVAQATSKPEPNSNPATISGGPLMKIEGAKSHKKCDHLKMHEERNYSFPGKKDEKSPMFAPLRDNLDITGNADMAKAIKKVLEENFQLNEEMTSQALIFKNLWLEAEAKLCSISYKARFDRMKIKMEETKNKEPQENEDIAEMMHQGLSSPDPITPFELAREACDIFSLEPNMHKASTSSTSGNADDDVEPSVLARFNILKSRGEKMKAMNMEEEQQPELVDGDGTAPNSIMARFRIPESREENLESIDRDEEKQPKIDGDADLIIARPDILKYLCVNSNPNGVDEVKQAKIFDDEFTGEKYLQQCVSGQLEDETLIVSQKPHLLHQTCNLNDGKFGLYGDGAVNESLNEYHPPATNASFIHSFKGSMMINENSSGSRGSSSSDWEHVLKEDISWKKC